MLAVLLNQEDIKGSRNRIMLCAPSNAAIDELLLRLVKGNLDANGGLRSVKAIRLGKVVDSPNSSEIEPFTIDYQVGKLIEVSGLPKQLATINEKIRKTLRELQSDSTNQCSQTRGRFDSPALKLLKSDRIRIEVCIDNLHVSSTKAIIGDAEIVVSTLSSTSSQLFLDHISANDISFKTVIIDEAGQTTEPSTLIPLRYGASSLVLVGDPR